MNVEEHWRMEVKVCFSESFAERRAEKWAGAGREHGVKKGLT